MHSAGGHDDRLAVPQRLVNYFIGAIIITFSKKKSPEETDRRRYAGP